jgi:hypothetical protein
MRKSLGIAAFAALAFAAPALADGPVAMSDVELDQVVAGSNGALGPFISSNVQDIYGNTTNPRDSGHGVTPTLAPGPWACADSTDCSAGAKAGGSIGEFVAPFASDGKGTPDFANGTDTIKTNFGEPYAHGGVGGP